MISLPRLLTIARKESRQLRRDTRSLILAFLVPVQMLLLFGYAISWDVRNIALGVFDGDQTESSRAVVDAFRGSGYFDVGQQLTRPGDGRQLLDRGDARAVLVIPRRFEQDLNAGRPTSAQLLVDGADANTATIVIGYAQATMASWATARGANPAVMALVPQTRIWYNQTLETRNMIIPGLVASIMMIVGSMLSAITIAREWERGTMEQLIATPVDRREIVIGKLLPYLVIGFIDVTMIVVVGSTVFHVPFRGSALLLGVSSFIYLSGTCALGLWIGAVAKTQLLAVQLNMLVAYLPGVLLSGASLDLSPMPRVLQLVSYAVPARYFVTLLKGIMLKGVGVATLWPDMLALVIYAGCAIWLGVHALQKRLAV
jgi:ABC-2 type transport system permease protein